MSLTAVKISELPQYGVGGVVLNPNTANIDIVVNVNDNTYRTDLLTLQNLRTLNLTQTIQVNGNDQSRVNNLYAPIFSSDNATITNLTNTAINSVRATITSLTGNVLGTVTGNLSGQARTANALHTTRSFRLSGDIVGETFSTLSNNLAIGTQLQANTVENSNVKPAAGIIGTKIVPEFGSQNITATGSITLDGATSTLPAVVLRNTNNGTGNSVLEFRKQRNSNRPSDTDVLGRIIFRGLDDNINGAQIQAIVNGVPSFGNLSTDLLFSTTNNNSHLERVRITKDGRVGVGTINTSIDAVLQVQGSTINDATPEIRVNGSVGYIDLHNSLTTGSYNPIVTNNDKAIIFSAGAVGTGNFVIAPWSSSIHGIRITDTGRVGINKSAPTSVLDVNGTITGTTLAGSLQHTLTRGSYLTGNSYNNSAATTWAVDATTDATASKIVARDGNGDVFARFLNINHAATDRTTDSVFYSSTDNYIRKNTAIGFRAALNVPTRSGADASGTWPINITGNAGTVTNGVYTAGNQTIAGIKTFSSNVLAPGYQANTGSVTAPSFYFSGDTDTGIYRPDADHIAIVTGGKQRMNIDSSGNMWIYQVTPSNGPGNANNTITTAQLKTGILVFQDNVTANRSWKMPTATDINALGTIAIDTAFEFILINESVNFYTVKLTTNTGVTFFSPAILYEVYGENVGRFLIRKTGATSYVVYCTARGW
jgi:hypothetical protein